MFLERLQFCPYFHRSVGVLVPLIEIDIAGRNFYMAQIRIAAISNVLLSCDNKAEEEMPAFAVAKKFLDQLDISGLTINVRTKRILIDDDDNNNVIWKIILAFRNRD